LTAFVFGEMSAHYFDVSNNSVWQSPMHTLWHWHDH